jgi:proline dehydrogenase
LGEGVRDATSAARVTAEFLEILDRVAAQGLDASLAVKLTHLGLDAGGAIALENVAAIVERAARLSIFVRIDMEESGYVNRTLEIFRELRRRGLANVGVVLQSYLRRSLNDLAAILPLVPNVRIVKGAYSEPSSLAYQSRSEIDAAFVELVAAALDGGAYVAVATHDRRLIDATLSLASPNTGGAERFEFQMLLGVRTALQNELARRGFPVRVSVPFGSDWYPYLMRRIAEKPANLLMILQNLH